MITTQTLNLEDNIGVIGSNMQAVYGRKFDYLALNNSSNILSNKEVRKAISYAINKKEIITNIYNGKYFEADYPLQYGSYLYNRNGKSFDYNIDKSKEILQNDGWTYSRAENGEKKMDITH